MKNNRIPKETLAELQTALRTKKQQLEAQLNSFATKDPNAKGDWDSKFPRIPQGNIEEAADEVEEYSTLLNIELTLENQLKDVDAALERVQEGEYGICEKCEAPIALERLKASPEARLCSQCNQ